MINHLGLDFDGTDLHSVLNEGLEIKQICTVNAEFIIEAQINRFTRLYRWFEENRLKQSI